MKSLAVVALNKKSQGINNFIRIHPLETMNVCTHSIK